MTADGPQPADCPSGNSWKVRLALPVTPHVFGTINLAAVAAMAPIHQAMVVETVSPRLGGTAMGYHVTTVPAGKAIGPPVFGLIADQLAYSDAWLMTGLGVLVAGVVLTRFFKERPPET